MVLLILPLMPNFRQFISYHSPKLFLVENSLSEADEELSFLWFNVMMMIIYM